jgi:hypothetical protein
MSAQPQRRPLPKDPLEHRQEAERLIDHGSNDTRAAVRALLAIAGELHEIRKLLGKRR